MASFLTGTLGSGPFEIPDRPATQSKEHALYIQDNWRATDKLTVNVGLRYDLALPRTERFNHMNYLDPDVPSPLQVPGLPPLRGGLVYANSKDRNVTGTDYNNLGPRFGFAYSMRPTLVLRVATGSFTTLRGTESPARSLPDSRDSVRSRLGLPPSRAMGSHLVRG